MGRIVVGVLGLMLGVAALHPTPVLAQGRYNCRDGATVVVLYPGTRHALLTFQGITYLLQQVPLFEGSRYSDGRFTWTVTRDREGTLTQDGAVIARECRTGAPPPSAGTTYTCAGGVTVVASYGGSTATVTFQGATHRLRQVPLFEGSRYSDGRFTWTVSRDEEGTLTRSGAVVAHDCRKAPPRPIEPER